LTVSGCLHRSQIINDVRIDQRFALILSQPSLGRVRAKTPRADW